MDRSKTFDPSSKHIDEIVSRHPRNELHRCLSGRHANQPLCTLCRELPNLCLAGY